jgi:hypothetical protein
MPQDTYKALPMVIVNSATLGVNYRSLNGGGFPVPVVYMRIMNGSNRDLLISYDGDDVHDLVGANSEVVIIPPISSLPNNKSAAISANLPIYGANAGGATGLINIVTYYV